MKLLGRIVILGGVAGLGVYGYQYFRTRDPEFYRLATKDPPTWKDIKDLLPTSSSPLTESRDQALKAIDLLRGAAKAPPIGPMSAELNDLDQLEIKIKEVKTQPDLVQLIQNLGRTAEKIDQRRKGTTP